MPHPVRRLVPHAAVFPGGSLSGSRPPRLGRSLRSRRMRSASPTLDPAVTHLGFGACEEDGSRAGPGRKLLAVQSAGRIDQLGKQLPDPLRCAEHHAQRGPLNRPAKPRSVRPGGLVTPNGDGSRWTGNGAPVIQVAG